MSEYQLELKQIVDYPRCRIYRQFIGLLMKDKNIRVGGTSRLYHFTVLSCFANFRTSYKRIEGISYTIYPGEWLCRVSELTEWFRTRFQHQALAILRELQDRHLITYTLLGRGKLVKFKIKGWCKYNRVLEYNAPCQKDTGFFFLPISVANELVSAGRCSEMDAMLDLWINTVYNDTQVQGSEVGPVVYMRNGTGSPLIGYAELAQRWGVSKATAGRYLRKMQELGYLSMVAFPGTHGTAIYLKQYLSTMFQISDVMIDKDEVAMSLNIHIQMNEETEDGSVSENSSGVSKSHTEIILQKAAKILAAQGSTVVRNYKSCGSGRERCGREGHAVFLRPMVDSAIMGSASTGISTSSTKLKMISTFCLRLPSDLSGAWMMIFLIYSLTIVCVSSVTSTYFFVSAMKASRSSPIACRCSTHSSVVSISSFNRSCSAS